MSSINLSNACFHVRHHAAAYGMALLMGALMLAPYAYFTTTPNYRGVEMMGQDAEEHYLARIQEARDGYSSLGNTFLPYKETPYLSPGLGEYLVAALGSLLDITTTEVNLLSKFLFPFFVFLLIYAFSFSISRSRSSSLLASSAAMLGTVLMSDPQELLALLRGTSATAGITWSRPINPEVSGLFLFGSLWLLYHVYRTRTMNLLRIFGLGSLIGLSLYISVYTWSFLGVFLIALLGYAVYERDFQFAKRLFLSGCIALIYAIPFFINYLHAAANAGYATAAAAQGALASHTPSIGLWILVLILIPLLVWPKTLAASRAFFILAGTALFIALNQQVITGFYLQPGHYHWYITKPLVLFVLALIAMFWIRHYYSRRLALCLAVVGILILFTDGILAQKVFYIKNLPEAEAVQAYTPLFNYLNQNPPGAVYAGRLLSTYVPIYTQSDAPANPYAIFYLTPPGYLEKVATLVELISTTTLRELGITSVIKDLSVDTWDAKGLNKAATINDRFEIYTVP